MIDIAVIAATAHLESLSACGTIDMALTHLVLDQPSYAAYFRARGQRGVTVLLDNSAYELQETAGAGLDADLVLRAAERIGAHVVVCQDVLFDGPATVEATRRFLRAARQTPCSVRPRFMGVPQGRTRTEWLRCYDELAAMPGIDVIGLSKLSVPRCFNAPVAEARLACVARLLAHHFPGPPFHLLGGDRSLPWELAEHHRLGHDRFPGGGGVRSNDSSFAFWYAALGIPVDADTGRAARDAPTKPDLASPPLAPDRLTAALGHIALLRSAAGLPALRPAPPTPHPVKENGTPCR